MARNRTRKKISIPSKYILLILSIVCIILMILSFTTEAVIRPINSIAGYVIVPFQKGISTVGFWMSDKADNFQKMNELIEVNNELQNKVDELSIQVNDLQRDKYELSELRQLYKLDEQYSDYEKIGARVIGKEAGNWFSSFLIDKGFNDGIQVDMNVMAGSGLVGIITEVGPNWASVKSIIDDDSNLSGMILDTSDTLIVSGGLETMNEGYISFSQLSDPDDRVNIGDQIVTSTISDKYLPNISIGYITEIDMDANNLTKSGVLTPVVDFKHLNTVLVITELKQTKE